MEDINHKTLNEIISVKNTLMEDKKMNFPDNPEEFADIYFVRAQEILRKDGLNPMVRAQVFVRKGPGIVAGVEEATDMLYYYTDIEEHGGHVYTLRDGEEFSPKETQMVIEAPVDDIMMLETQYLGPISSAITLVNDGTEIDLDEVRNHMRAIKDMVPNRPVAYLGARHWHYKMDAAISKAAFDGGADMCSTVAGAKTVGKNPIGTIPHALENVYAWKYGKDRAVVEATKAFDRHMDSSIPRVALIDYNNKEITDSIVTADALEGRLSAVRVDTPGENIAEGALSFYNSAVAESFFGREVKVHSDDEKYWAGNGVTISGVYALRKALDDAGHDSVGIFLSSGFGDLNKVRAFVDAEQQLGMKLFDAIGVGGLFHSRAATMDIVGVGNSIEELEPISKVGRVYNPNPRLEERILVRCV